MLINELPDEILCYTISFLSPKDAATARSLSRRWRSLFASSVNLDLNPFTVIGITAHSNNVNPFKYRQILSDYKSKFMDGVDQILEQCTASFIDHTIVDTVRFSFQLSSESASRIDRWISLALQMNPRKLHLDFSLSDTDMELYRAKPYHLPLQCIRAAYGKSKTFPRLEHLILKSCLLGISPNPIAHLYSLKRLDLYGIALSQPDLDRVFSGCSNLQWLEIGNCCLPETLHIGGEGCLPHLERVIVDNCERKSIMELNSLRKLRTFEFMNVVGDINFIGVPLLEKVHWRVFHGNGVFRSQILEKLAIDLSRLQFLSLFGSFPKEPPMTEFKHLKELEIFFFSSRNNKWITQLVNASPILQKLHVTVSHLPLVQLWILRNEIYPELHPTQCHFHLKEVRINGFRGSPNEMQLAISLLKISSVLYRMYIDPTARMYRGANEWSSRGVKWKLDEKRVREQLLRETPNPRVEITVV